MFRFKTFQGRLVFFFLGLVSLIQVIVFATVDATNLRYAREQIETTLELGARTFRRLIETRTEQLSESVRILAGDFAFKTAIASGDVPTVRSALENHGARIGADIMLLVSSGQELIADTAVPHLGALPGPMHLLVRTAEQRDRAWAIVDIGGVPYRILVLPVLAPVPIAWIAAGFKIDDRLARDLEQFTKLGVSFFHRREGGSPEPIASSLDKAIRDELSMTLARLPPPTERVVSIELNGEEFLILESMLAGTSGAPIGVVLQRSLAQEMAPFRELRNSVFLLSAGGLLLSLFGAMFIGRSVSRPVRALARAAQRVEKGDYDLKLDTARKDEFGDLAVAFNSMVRGLAERDQVRSVLGKVVSRAVAEDLLRRGIELGGEERVVTVLFVDLRNFTAFCEERSPQQVVAVLNTYFTAMGDAIEAHGGVIDKYLGDGIMALFGAPVTGEDDAGNALAAALAMSSALDGMNADLAGRGLPALEIGIGINTDVVVAGNMGSPSRLNYTVIGDGVNLASRLEGLTKDPKYRTRIIASEGTIQRTKRKFALRSLGEVSVKGKSAPIQVYAVLGPADGAAKTTILPANEIGRAHV